MHNARKIGRQRHEAVIAVDHDEGVRVRYGVDDVCERASRGCRIEEHMAHEHEVVAAAARRGCKARGEIVERFGGDALDRDQAVFLQPRDLAGEGMKFAVAREDAQRPQRQRRQQPQHEFVGVGRERNRCRIGQRQQRRDAALRARDHLAEDLLPFAVGEPRGVGDRLAMRLAGGVGPIMVAVRGEVDASGRGLAELRKMRMQVERHRGAGLRA